MLEYNILLIYQNCKIYKRSIKYKGNIFFFNLINKLYLNYYQLKKIVLLLGIILKTLIKFLITVYFLSSFYWGG